MTEEEAEKMREEGLPTAEEIPDDAFSDLFDENEEDEEFEDEDVEKEE